MSSTEDDMRARWLPTDAAIRHAVALLEAEPTADMAVVPMCQPGKQRGWWKAGQEVHTVPGVVLLAVNRQEGTGTVPHYGIACLMADQVGREALRLDGRGGTAAHATVTRDGHVAVFEDFEQVEPTEKGNTDE